MSNLTKKTNDSVNVAKDRFETFDSDDATLNYCLTKMGTTSTTFSMDSSDSSMMSTIHEVDDDSTSTVDSENYNDYRGRNQLDAAVAGECLYLRALDRSTQLKRNTPMESVKVHRNTTPSSKNIKISTVRKINRINRLSLTSTQSSHNESSRHGVKRIQIIKSENLNTIGLTRSTINEPSSPIFNTTKMQQTVKFSNAIHSDETKLKIKINDKKESISETASNRLYLKGLERDKRLALLRNSRYVRQKSSLSTTERSSKPSSRMQHDSTPCYIQPNKTSKCNQSLSEVYKNGGDDVHKVISRCKPSRIKSSQRLYALSKPMQEDGRKRRENIVKAQKKVKEGGSYPKDKICSTAASRLYYIGMGQLIALEQRRIMASEPGVYKSRLLPTVRSNCPD